MAVERLYINNTYIPLTDSLNPSITKSVSDISEPDKRKATYSKTVSIPRSKEADKIFSQIFEFNAINLTFNVNAKTDVRYECDSEVILRGYIKLNSIGVNDFQDITYDCTMYSVVADFFADIKGLKLNALDLSEFDHELTKEIQQLSWDTSIIQNGGLVAFAFGKGYVYPLIDFGLSQNATDFIFTQIAPAIYEHELMKRIISEAGYTYTSTFLDSSFFKHLIVPSSPDCFQLTDDDIEDREFNANTPEFTSTGTTTSNNLPNATLSSADTIIFTDDSTPPAFDPNGVYDTTNGKFTVAHTGVYDLNALIDINATFTPSTLVVNLKTNCEIDGYLMMFVNGVQVDALPFYITKYDTSFYAGARSTSTTPTYPDPDYMEGKAWSKPVATTPVGRIAYTPDRYLLSVQGYPLVAGDEVEVKWKAGIYGESTSSFFYIPSPTMFIDNVNALYTGNATLSVVVGAFYNKVSNLTLSEGNTLLMANVIPSGYSQIDYFMSNVKRFNLIVDVDPANPRNLIIEPLDDYLGTDVLNIHELIDRSKEMDITPMGVLDAKRYIYSYKSDKDYFNQKYEASYQEIYGQRICEVDNEFIASDKKTEIIFSPTPSVGLPNNDRVLPTIYGLNQLNQPITTKFNIRSLYYAGMLPCLNGWNHTNYILSYPHLPLTDTFVEYPYAGHFDDPYNPTLDINFGLVKEVYYDDNINDIVATDNNLVNKYHAKLLREITDPDSKIVKAYVHLTPLSYVNFTFDKLYYFDFAYFRLQKIEGYNPVAEETTLCTFLKVKTAGSFTPATYPVTGAPQPIEPAQTGGGIGMTEHTPTKGTRSFSQPDGNNYSGKNVVVQGDYNYVNGTAKNIEIYGDSNKVFAEAKNIKIQGSSNTISAGVTNVTLINSNGLTITESNVTYVNGLQLSVNPNRIESISADQDWDPSVLMYQVDASAGNVSIDLDPTTYPFVESQLIYLYRLDNTPLNFCRVTTTGCNIDVVGTNKNITVQYSSFTLMFSGGNFYTVI